MRLWIIGKWGMLAQAMQRASRAAGIEFVATTRKEVNLLDEGALTAQFKTLNFSHVINCSGYTAVDQAEEETEAAHALNEKGVELLAKLCAKHGKKLLHFSTDYVFDGKAGEYEAEDAPSPLSVYGRSKAAGEAALLRHHPEGCIIRTSWLFGKEGSCFVKKMIMLMQERERLQVVDDQRGRPTYADDLAEAALGLLESSGIHHFSNSGETSWHGFATEILEKLKGRGVKCQEIEPISSETFGAKAVRPERAALKSSKSSRPWNEGVDEVIAHVLGS
ncbi:MAG: dTDP-4-dehydrorhamnose reductase [Chlamydiia bacterium]|nr:dTDP-4-dehydrorhamnose reductase [Chlamydiia bacterium]